MKKFLFILFISMVGILSAHLSPQEEHKLLEIISTNHDLAKELVNEIKSNPGSYPPAVLTFTGLYFAEEKDFETAATLCTAGIGRCHIEVILENIPKSIAFSLVSMVKSKINDLSDSDKTLFKKASKNAITHFEKWDRETPRDYREFPDEQKLQEAVERFYRDIKVKEVKKDYANASYDDEYYFDQMNRIFFSKEASLSFEVPALFKPSLDLHGKYNGMLHEDDNAKVYVTVNWSSREDSFQWDYEYETKYHPENKTVFDMEGADFPIYLVRTIHEGGTTVENELFIKRDPHYTFVLTLQSSPEKEDELLEVIAALIESIKFN